ncbi:MAG: TIGR03663 family protein [bacterium]|nr:TIGR03663 family protein [bacterium]
MATVDQPLSPPGRVSQNQGASLNPVLSRVYTLNWEVILYGLIFVAALFTRFYELGARVMSHDESLHTLYSYNLYLDGNFQHTPLMHGPILFHFTALFYHLFGPSDFSARIYAALLGVLIVMFPLLFRRWLGKWGAILASLMLLISPLMMFYSRYIREDMPAIIASIAMFYAIVMYLDGPENQRRRPHWLYLLSGAMLWNLGSKETAFMYIGIFGLFLTIYWLVRLAQEYLGFRGKPIFYTIIIGFLLALVAALGMIVVISVALGSRETVNLIGQTLGLPLQPNNEYIVTLADRLNFLGNQMGAMLRGEPVSTDFVGFLTWTVVVVVSILGITFGTALWAYKSGKTFFTVPDLLAVPLTLLILLAVGGSTTLSVGIIVALSFGLVYGAIRLYMDSSVGIGTLYIAAAALLLALYWFIGGRDWLEPATLTGALTIGLTFVIAVGLALVISQSFGRPSFGGRAALVLLVALVICLGLLIVEELSFEPSRAEETAEQIEPGQEAVAADEDGFSLLPVALAWVFGAVAIAFVLFLKQRGVVESLARFPELDVLMVMGTLVLPWCTAVFIVATHGVPQDFINLANSLPEVLRNNIPVGDVNPGQEIEMVGRVTVGFLAWLPLMATSIVAGLAWNWRRWIVCSAIFHALFAFFFTTIFTNIAGLATGMIYSLQYWLEQQGVRRGSQPQYYYLLVIMPFYEFLPVIGGVLAMLAGMVMFWRQQRARRQPEYAYETAAYVALPPDGEPIEASTRQQRSSSDEPSLGELLGEDGAEIVEEQAAAETPKRQRGESVPEADRLTRIPFLLFVAFWGGMNLYAFTLAGEKMPWLGTHLTVPLIFLSGWYFGRIIEGIDLRRLVERGWLYAILLPFLFITVFQIFAPYLGGRPPFLGQERQQLAWTYGWLAVVGISAVLISIIFRQVERTGWKHLRQMFAVAAFGVLAIITLRTAWIAAFINYDYGTEYLVYAHGGPGNRIVVDQLRELSLRTTGDMDIVFAYDDGMHWPGLWYFRDFPNKIGFGNNPTLQQIDQSAVVVVAQEGLMQVQPLLQDDFQQFTYVRMYWPMQDYFDLNTSRINNLVDLSADNPTAGQIRRGVFNIWWSRDYQTYANAIGRPDAFQLTRWPLMDEVHFFVRKDIASQVWPLGIGDGTAVAGLPEEPETACVTNWQPLSANLVFNTTNVGLNRPIGLAVSPDNQQVFVAEEGNNRISIFTTDGQYVSSFGQQGTAAQPGAFFERPHDVSFAPDGRIYVADFWNHRIRVFDASLEYLTGWGQPITVGFDAPREPTDGLYGPRRVLVGPDGSVYVMDTGNKRIRVYSAEGVFLGDIGSGGSAEGQFDEPVGMALHPDGRLFVADTWNRRISVFDSASRAYLTSFPVEGWVGKPNALPYIALDGERDLLYVSDGDAGRINVYNSAGECVGGFGQFSLEGPNAAQFAAIGGLALDSQGQLYVSDVATGRILRFAPFPVPNPAETAGEGDAIESFIEQMETTEEVIPLEFFPEETSEVTAEATPETTEGRAE